VKGFGVQRVALGGTKSYVLSYRVGRGPHRAAAPQSMIVFEKLGAGCGALLVWRSGCRRPSAAI